MRAIPGSCLHEKTETLAKGTAIKCTQSKAQALFDPIDYYTITAGNGTAVDATGTAVTTYSGISDVTVTYTYKRNLHSLKIIKMDVDTNTRIDEQTISGFACGQTVYICRKRSSKPSSWLPLHLDRTRHPILWGTQTARLYSGIRKIRIAVLQT